MKFNDFNKRNCQQFFELYMKNKEPALKQFKQAYKADGGDDKLLNFSVESLVPAWAWAKSRMPLSDSHPASDEKVPIWYDPEIRLSPWYSKTAFNKDALNVIDSLGYYVGEVFVHNMPFNARWDIDMNAKPKSIHTYKPVVKNDYFQFCPIYNGVILALIASDPNDARFRDGALFDMYHHYKRDAETYKAELTEAVANPKPASSPKVRGRKPP